MLEWYIYFLTLISGVLLGMAWADYTRRKNDTKR